MISQSEAVSLINRTIFRPGWRLSARPAPDSTTQVLAGIEVQTVDSSFLSRGGDYQVPLTERALVLVDSRDYATPEALLFRLLGVIRELQEHEDREFMRVWDGEAERWAAPFHEHSPEGQRAWDRMKALPQPSVTRLHAGSAGPWVADAAACEYVCWAEDDNKARTRAVNAGCDMEEDRGDCWESGNAGRKVLADAGCADNDDDPEEGPQRARAEADCTLGPPERELLVFASAEAHTAAHPVAVAGCNECDGGCASWGKRAA